MTLLYTILITTTIYLGVARSSLTAPIRPFMPLPIMKFLDCPMCAGAWYGMFVSMLAIVFGYHYPGLPDQHAPIVLFFGSAVWTPLLAGWVDMSIERLGMAADLADRAGVRDITSAPGTFIGPAPGCAHGYSWDQACESCGRRGRSVMAEAERIEIEKQRAPK